jgi:hypothetical protein
VDWSVGAKLMNMESAAGMLYGLIHVCYILTSKGMMAMVCELALCGIVCCWSELFQYYVGCIVWLICMACFCNCVVVGSLENVKM